MTAQGHPRSVFQRAIEHGNLGVAEATLRELGRPTLVELLELTALIAQRDPRRHGRVAARWLQRLLEQHPDLTVDDAVLVGSTLQALGGRHHAYAMATLRAIADEAATRSQSGRLRAPAARRGRG